MSLRRNSWLIRYKGSPLTYLAFRMLAAREGVRMLFRSSSFGSVRFHDRLVVLSGIRSHMVFFDCVDCRLYPDSL